MNENIFLKGSEVFIVSPPMFPFHDSTDINKGTWREFVCGLKVGRSVSVQAEVTSRTT